MLANLFKTFVLCQEKCSCFTFLKPCPLSEATEILRYLEPLLIFDTNLIIKYLLFLADSCINPVIQIGQPQPHDGPVAATSLQRVALSLLARHYCARGAADSADGASRRSQLR